MSTGMIVKMGWLAHEDLLIEVAIEVHHLDVDMEEGETVLSTEGT
jgi:hypothetical protein